MMRFFSSDSFIWNSLVGALFLSCLVTSQLSDLKSTFAETLKEGSSPMLLAEHGVEASFIESKTKDEGIACQVDSALVDAFGDLSTFGTNRDLRHESSKGAKAKNLNSNQISWSHLREQGRRI